MKLEPIISICIILYLMFIILIAGLNYSQDLNDIRLEKEHILKKVQNSLE